VLIFSSKTNVILPYCLKVGRQYLKGYHCGRSAALAFGWQSAHTLSMEARCKFILSVDFAFGVLLTWWANKKNRPITYMHTEQNTMSLLVVEKVSAFAEI
jgi:hypothetical protein